MCVYIHTSHDRAERLQVRLLYTMCLSSLAVLHPHVQFLRKFSLIFDDFLSFPVSRGGGLPLPGLGKRSPALPFSFTPGFMECADPSGGCRGPDISWGLLGRSNTPTQSFFPFHLPKNSVFFACCHSDCGWQSPDPLPSDPGLLLLSAFLLPSHCSIPHTGEHSFSSLLLLARMNLQHLPQKEETLKNKPSRSASQTCRQAGPKSLSLGKATLPVTSHSLQQPAAESTGDKGLSNTFEQRILMKEVQAGGTATMSCLGSHLWDSPNSSVFAHVGCSTLILPLIIVP